MPQDTENWELLQRLFHLTEATPEPDRERVLETRCADPELRRRVLTMLHYADAPERTVPADYSPPHAGKLGPYSLLRHVGTGGMGSVWLAERIFGGSPQRVALKILAPHAGGPAFVERFHREEHILAGLDHPHITRMLDAGMSETGQPWLAMEYVQGAHIDRFCDAKKMDTRHRIALFLQVCDAVAYAHRHLIVHLDLKPSNVLVNDEGTVKLLDFGTSKLIQPDALMTTTVLATPAYASPEQLRNEPVTTACDIYSLGVILFDLLAGHRPGNTTTATALFERAVNEKEPERLTDSVTADAAENRGASEARLRQMLAGDLTTITAKCMRPRPKDRYPSVDALADDLRRYLAGRSVLARPQTVRYRVGKFVRRHRTGLAAACLVTSVLLAALVFAGWRQHQAVVEGRRAMRMQTFMYGMFKEANIYSAGQNTMTLPQFLTLGAQKLPEYIKDPVDLRRAQLAIAESMRDNQDLQNAEPLFKQVLATAQAAGDVNAAVEAGAFAGDIAYRNGDVTQGEALTAQALRLSSSPGVTPAARVWSEMLYAMHRDEHGYQSDANLRLMEHAAQEAQQNDLGPHDTAFAFFNLGEDYLIRGMLDQAEQAYRKALAALGAVEGSCGRAGIEVELGLVVARRGDVAASIPILERSYDGYVHCSGPKSVGALTAQGTLAEELTWLGRGQQALSMMQSAMPEWRKLGGPSSASLIDPLWYLTHAEVATSHFSDAERDAKELLGILKGRVNPESHFVGAGEWMLAEALAGQGRWQEAQPHAQRADEILSHGQVLSPEAMKINARVHQLRGEIDSHIQTH